MANRAIAPRPRPSPTPRGPKGIGGWKPGAAANDNFGKPANDNFPALPKPRNKTPKAARGLNLPRGLRGLGALGLAYSIYKWANFKPENVENTHIMNYAGMYDMICGSAIGIPGGNTAHDCGWIGLRFQSTSPPKGFSPPPARCCWYTELEPPIPNPYDMRTWQLNGKGKPKAGAKNSGNPWAPGSLSDPATAPKPNGMPGLNPSARPGVNNGYWPISKIPFSLLPYKGSHWPGIGEESTSGNHAPGLPKPPIVPKPGTKPNPDPGTTPKPGPKPAPKPGPVPVPGPKPDKPPPKTKETKIQVMNPFGVGPLRSFLEWQSEADDMIDIWFWNGLTPAMRKEAGYKPSRQKKLELLWKYRHQLDGKAIWWATIQDYFSEKMQAQHGKQVKRVYKQLFDKYGSGASILGQGVYRIGSRALRDWYR